MVRGRKPDDGVKRDVIASVRFSAPEAARIEAALADLSDADYGPRDRSRFIRDATMNEVARCCE